MELKLTGERVIPIQMNPRDGLLKEHIARYRFAKEYAKGRVLDIACGVGYAVPILFNNSLFNGTENHPVKEYIGVDSDEAAIRYAKHHYTHPKAAFIKGDACDFSLYRKLGWFDTIISLETIEHLEKDYDFVKNLAVLLKPGGTLIISSPFGRGRGIKCSNPFHVHQYKEEEFRQLLSPFKEVKMHYQVDQAIEGRIPGKKYYLMVAVCRLS